MFLNEKILSAAKGQNTQSVHFPLKQDKQWQTFTPGHRKELYDHIKAEVLKLGVSPHLLYHFLFEVSLVCIYLLLGFYPLNRIVIEQFGFLRK